MPPPTLTSLKQKWFIDVHASGRFPPQTRHAGSAVFDSTDGNRATLLRDGSNFMGRWYTEIQSMTTGSPSACELWHTGWRLEAVKTLGASKIPSGDALELLKTAAAAGVKVLGMISRHIPGMIWNSPSLAWLRLNGVTDVVFDNRFPYKGSGHQKFSCFRNPAGPKCLVGSIDISKTRWDTPAHAHTDPDRDPNPLLGKPTHDTGVLVEGPAVSDIETTFKERWNDSTRTIGLWKLPAGAPPPPITAPVSSPAPIGTHSIQVLHTYGISKMGALFSYSWATVGEFTGWAAYLNAIKKATSYIYIEDQYFLPFESPPLFKGSGRARDTDLIYQLGEAIKNGVKVLILTPSNAEDAWHVYQKYQRDVGIEYLFATDVQAAGPGDCVVASLTNGTSDVYIHSKLMIIDDEVVFIGSTNLGQRSASFDTEIQLAIVDSANLFAKDARKALYAEHLGVGLPAVDDPIVAYNLFKAATFAPTGHVKAYPYVPPAVQGKPVGNDRVISKWVDPYGGPPR